MGDSNKKEDNKGNKDKKDKKESGGDDGGGGGSVTVHYVPVDEIVDDIRGIIENVEEQKKNPGIAESIETFRIMLDKIVIMIKLFGALGGAFFYFTGFLVNKIGGAGAFVAIIASMLFCIVSGAWSGLKILNSIQPQEGLKNLAVIGLTALSSGTFNKGTPPMEQIKTVLYSHLNNCGKTKYFVELTAQCIFSLVGFITSFIQLFSPGPHFGFFGIPLAPIIALSIFGIFLTAIHSGGLIVWVIITLGLIFGKVIGKILNALRCNFNDTCENEVQDVHVYGVEQQKATAEIKEKQQSADVQAVSKKDILSAKPITKKEKKLIIKCYKNKGEEEKLGKLMKEIVVNPEDHKTNGEIDNKLYGDALKKARKKITSIIAECNSGMYKDINKLIGLNYGKLDELEQKTANTQDEYTKKINTRVNFAMRKLEDKAANPNVDINSLVVDKEIVKAWKNRKQRSKIVKGSRAVAGVIPSAFNWTKNKLTNIEKTKKAYKLYDNNQNIKKIRNEIRKGKKIKQGLNTAEKIKKNSVTMINNPLRNDN